MIFAIDFDGTIVSNAYPEIGDLNVQMADFIIDLKSKGHRWILWTCRMGKELEAALTFLKENNLNPDYVNEPIEEIFTMYPDNPRKIFADCYIDDRNAGGLVIPWELI